LINGKTIYLSIEEFLNLTDADVQYMVSCNYGEVITSPMYGSALKHNSKEKEVEKKYDFSDYHTDDDPDEDIEINPNDFEEMQ
jgi:hypothetical protein